MRMHGSDLKRNSTYQNPFVGLQNNTNISVSKNLTYQ